MFLTKNLGWKDGLNEENNATFEIDPHDVTKLAKYLFVTGQMG